jgi:uncharacterized protein (DUF1330 family)
MTITYLHNVLFNFKDDVPQAERERVVASIESQKDADGIESMRVYRNLSYDPAGDGYEWIVMLDFLDEDRAFAFRTSADHEAQVARDFTPNHRGFIALNVHQAFDRKIAERIDSGFRHIEMFNFKKHLGQDDRQRVLTAIGSQGQRPGVNRIVVGENVRPKSESAPLDWFVMMEFADRDAYGRFSGSADYAQFRADVLCPAQDDLIIVDVEL